MNQSHSFEGALSQWLVLHTLGRKPRSQEFNQEIVGIITRLWPGRLDGPVESITVEEVTGFAAKVTHYCPSRWNAILSALQSITPAARSLQRRPLRAKERALLSPAEFARLLEALDQRPQSHAGLVIRFLSLTGLRINEARQVQWSFVREDCLQLPGSITKNGRPRVLPFVNGLADTLTRLRTISTGPAVLPQAECKRSLQQACVAAGVPRLSHHDFRHLFATRCIQSGVDLPTVARWLGHSDGGALLARTYFHLVDEHSRKMASKVMIAT